MCPFSLSHSRVDVAAADDDDGDDDGECCSLFGLTTLEVFRLVEFLNVYDFRMDLLVYGIRLCFFGFVFK